MIKGVPVWCFCCGMVLSSRRMRGMAPKKLIRVVTINHKVMPANSRGCWLSIRDVDSLLDEFGVQFEPVAFLRRARKIAPETADIAIILLSADMYESRIRFISWPLAKAVFCTVNNQSHGVVKPHVKVKTFIQPRHSLSPYHCDWKTKNEYEFYMTECCLHFDLFIQIKNTVN